MTEKITQSQLSVIETSTVGHYENNAASFWSGTKDHDVTQNYAKFLSQFEPERTLDILDFGCGPGRDLIHFQSLDHRPVGLDGSEAFCKMARANSTCPVLYQQFLSLNLPSEAFDGVFANASLFHIPGQELQRVLKDLHSTLRPNGILFSSNPRGSSEGWSGQRYGHFMEFEETQENLQAAGFKVIEHYYRPPDAPRSEQPWLAVVSRRLGKPAR